MTLLSLLICGAMLYAGLRFHEYKHNFVHLAKSHNELLNQNVTQQQHIKKLQQELQELKSSLQINPPAQTQTQKIEDLFVMPDQESKLHNAYKPWVTSVRPELVHDVTNFGGSSQGYGSKSSYIHDSFTSSSGSSSDCSSSSSSSSCD